MFDPAHGVVPGAAGMTRCALACGITVAESKLIDPFLMLADRPRRGTPE